MIAVYCNHNASPNNMFVLDVENNNHNKFLEALKASQYPFPTSEVLFMENDRVVSFWRPFANY